MLDEEQIQKNWELFCNLAENGLEKNNSKAIEALLNELGDRLLVTPLSVKSSPGSLIDHNLKCLKVCSSINKKFHLGISEHSMILVNLFRNVGMVGSLDGDLLLVAPEWLQKKGTHYQYNNDIIFMQPHDRSLFLLQHYGVKMSEEEVVAILASNGSNQEYKFGDPPLSFATYTAMRIVDYRTQKENKENEE